MPAKNGIRYGFDDQGRLRTAEHYEGTRPTTRVAVPYEANREVWLSRVGNKTFVKCVRLVDERPVEWYETSQESLALYQGTYDDHGRLIEIIGQSITPYTKGKVAETRDRLEYDANGGLVRIARTAFGSKRILYRAKPRAAKAAASQGPSPAQAAKAIALVVERYLQAHAARAPLAVALAYDQEARSPAPPLLGIVWRDEYQPAQTQSNDLRSLLNPAEYDTFDIPELALDDAQVEAGVSSVKAQRKYYLEVAQALAAELGRSLGKKARKLVVYATDLECNDLKRNLEALGIKNVNAG